MKTSNLKASLIIGCCFIIALCSDIKSMDTASDLQKTTSYKAKNTSSEGCLDSLKEEMGSNSSGALLLLNQDENKYEDGSYSGLAKVAFDQFVTQPCQAVLSTAAAFCKFSYQHPATALAMTATFALPVVAALLPEQSSNLWYPQFTCAHVNDIQQITTYIDRSGWVTLNFATAHGGYEFTPNTNVQGYASATQCAYAANAHWYGPNTNNGPTACYSDANCTSQTSCSNFASTNLYQLGQANYTGFYSSVLAPGISATSWCAQATAP